MCKGPPVAMNSENYQITQQFPSALWSLFWFYGPQLRSFRHHWMLLCLTLELIDHFKKDSPTNRMSTKKAPSSSGVACGRPCSLVHTLWRISSTSSLTSMLTLRCKSHGEIWKKCLRFCSKEETGLDGTQTATPEKNKMIQWMNESFTVL